jgi:hypothetical protein
MRFYRLTFRKSTSTPPTWAQPRHSQTSSHSPFGAPGPQLLAPSASLQMAPSTWGAAPQASVQSQYNRPPTHAFLAPGAWAVAAAGGAGGAVGVGPGGHSRRSSWVLGGGTAGGYGGPGIFLLGGPMQAAPSPISQVRHHYPGGWFHFGGGGCSL